VIGRRVDSVEEITQPGDYYLNEHGTEGADDRALWFWLPVNDPNRFEGRPQLNRITEPPWTFRECADGSIEVRASILTYTAISDPQPLWHGFLDEGHVWREC
jgi:hypothetical protein